MARTTMPLEARRLALEVIQYTPIKMASGPNNREFSIRLQQTDRGISGASKIMVRSPRSQMVRRSPGQRLVSHRPSQLALMAQSGLLVGTP